MLAKLSFGVPEQYRDQNSLFYQQSQKPLNTNQQQNMPNQLWSPPANKPERP